MNTFGERLRGERSRLKLNQDAFAEAGGVKKRAQITYEQDERSPDADYLQRIAAIGVDVMYVITGVASAATLTKEETELLVAYRNLDLRGKAGVLGMLGGLLQAPERSAEFYGEVGQTVQGDVTAPFTINMPGKKKK